MKTTNRHAGAARRLANHTLHAAICVAAMHIAAPLQADTIYRTTGSTGQVGFTDKAPANAVKATTLNAELKPAAATANPLPFELRLVASKYPVMLYSAANCPPCDSGRALLSRRGVPFSEKTVNSAEDGEALRRISGVSSLPLLTIGAQHIKGFSESEWTQFLNAAEYPQSSILPTGYANPPAAPLVAQQKPLTDKPGEPQARLTPLPPVPPFDPAANPAGIRF